MTLLTGGRLSSARRPIQPAIPLLAGAAVGLASQAYGLLTRPPSNIAVLAGPTSAAAPAAPDAPAADGAPLATIDASLARWSANLRSNPRDFISATNLSVLYSGRARLTGNAADFTRALEAADRALGI